MKPKLKKFRKAPIQPVVKKLRLYDAPVLFPEMSINLWQTGIGHAGLVELDRHACQTNTADYIRQFMCGGLTTPNTERF
jgi:hypothetical protein